MAPAANATVKPSLKPLKYQQIFDDKVHLQKVPMSLHRYTPLKKAWFEIYTPIHEQMKINVRINLNAMRVELGTRFDTLDTSNIQKCADFVHAFILGFDACDAATLLRVDELCAESFEIKDAKTPPGSRCNHGQRRRTGPYDDMKVYRGRKMFVPFSGSWGLSKRRKTISR